MLAQNAAALVADLVHRFTQLLRKQRIDLVADALR
jgi:hypothetical protein